MKNRNYYIFITIVITLCVQISCSTIDGTEPKQAGVSPEAITSAIAQADELFKQRENVAKLREALSVLTKVRDPYSRNYELEWKYAKYSYFLGTMTPEKKEAEAIFARGREAGNIALNMEKGRPDGHFWYGANLGELSRFNLITVGLPSVSEIRNSMNKVIELDPSYQNTSAYDVLAQIELETRMYGGRAEKAVELLEKALESEKENQNLHLRLAQAYLVIKKDGEARKQLDTLLKMKPDPEYVLEYRAGVELAKKMLQTKF